MKVVVDASVAAKWFLPEAQSKDAAGLLANAFTLCAPDLLRLEVSSTLTRAMRRKDITRDEAQDSFARLSSLAIEFVAAGSLAEQAFNLAVIEGGSVYDALYLVLAKSLGTVLVTCDLGILKVARQSRIDARLLDRFAADYLRP